MTSSTKPEVHNILHYRHAEDRATATGITKQTFREVWTRRF